MYACTSRDDDFCVGQNGAQLGCVIVDFYVFLVLKHQGMCWADGVCGVAP